MKRFRRVHRWGGRWASRIRRGHALSAAGAGLLLILIASCQTIAPPVRRVQAWEPTSKPRPWRYIVIHHSATAAGGAAYFNRMHRLKGWDGLGYHFVIGNGTDTADGAVEVGWRWPIQREGAHARAPASDTNKYNLYGIGICLVGNFEERTPSPRQMASLRNLVSYLVKRHRINKSRVLCHRDVKSTACPGSRFPFQAFLAGLP